MATLSRRLKTTAKRSLYLFFVAAQRLGVNVIPAHFYSTVPNITTLRRTRDWRKPSQMVGVKGTALQEQLSFLERAVTPAVAAALATRNVHQEAIAANGSDEGYGEIEANALYAIVHTLRPRHVLQIGAGVSTAVVQAAANDAGYTPRLTCIDPFPTPLLRSQAERGSITVHGVPAQQIPIGIFTELGAGDVLFIDSTHAVKAGSEVNFIILEVLPRLNPGVIVHFHDIYFPYDYSRSTVDGDFFFGGESTLLHAFLSGNGSYRIICSLSMLHYGAPAALQHLFPRYAPQANNDGLRATGGRHFPSSTWLERVSDPSG